MFRNRSVSLALVGLFLWVTGCTSYKQIELSEVADYGEVRVTLTDGAQRDFYRATAEADSLKGRLDTEGTAVYGIPLDQVSTVEVGRISAGKTIGLVFGVTLGVIVAAYAISCASDPDQLGC